MLLWANRKSEEAFKRPLNFDQVSCVLEIARARKRGGRWHDGLPEERKGMTWTRPRLAELRQLRLQGKSYVEIARLMGLRERQVKQGIADYMPFFLEKWMRASRARDEVR